MEYLIMSFSDIKSIDKEGIHFKNGDSISFAECIGSRYNSSTCVAERDILALPPYFEFFSPNIPTRVIFNRKGILSGKQNHRDFLRFQSAINKFGFSTYDLS